MADPKDYYTDRRTIFKLYRMFMFTHNILLKNKISYYASGGTLIGALRHKGIINWDDDIDIEVSYKDIPLIMSSKIKAQFEKKGFVLKYHHEEDSTDQYDWVKVMTKTKVRGHYLALDIFPMVVKLEKSSGRYRTYFASKICNSIWKKYYLYTDELTPLRKEKFGDGYVIVPANAEQALSRAYGKDWKTVGYITQDQEHYDLDEPIKLSSKKFKAAKDFYPCDKQLHIDIDNPLVTLSASTFII